jgi:hypothetical protein
VLRDLPNAVFITEGEMDACALVEAGIPQNQVLSVPTGAVERPADKPMDERGYGYALEALKAGSVAVKRFVWCGDNGRAGASSAGRYGEDAGRGAVLVCRVAGRLQGRRRLSEARGPRLSPRIS